MKTPEHFFEHLRNGEFINDSEVWRMGLGKDLVQIGRIYLPFIWDMPDSDVWPIVGNIYGDYMWERYVNIADAKGSSGKKKDEFVKCEHTGENVKQVEISNETLDLVEQVFRRYHNYQGEETSINNMMSRILYLSLEWDWSGHMSQSVSMRNVPLVFREKWDLLLKNKHKWNGLAVFMFFLKDDREDWRNTMEFFKGEDLEHCLTTLADYCIEVNHMEFGRSTADDICELAISKQVSEGFWKTLPEEFQKGCEKLLAKKDEEKT